MALNDPQWGKKGRNNNEGPPDLDEMWRSFNQKLNSIFGKKGGSSPNSPVEPNMKQIGGGIGLVAALIAAIWLASGFYIVDESQRGIVLTFGKYSQTTTAGLRWRLPYPIQTHELLA